MPVKVVDASAVAALVFGEPEASEVAARLRGATLAAPALLAFEVASVCLKKLKRHPEQRESLLAAFGLFKRVIDAQFCLLRHLDGLLKFHMMLHNFEARAIFSLRAICRRSL
jgi:predicted nucleic acid-binding protein